MSKKPYRDHEEATIESFQNDPRFAAEYLNAVLEDGDLEDVHLATSRYEDWKAGRSRTYTLEEVEQRLGLAERDARDVAIIDANAERLNAEALDALDYQAGASSGRARPRSTKRR